MINLRFWLSSVISASLLLLISCATRSVSAPTEATRESPYVNSLGMRFIPLSSNQVLMAVWETRVADFARFVSDSGYDAVGDTPNGKRGYSAEPDAQDPTGISWQQVGATWLNPRFPDNAAQSDDHPVTYVSYLDALAFCDWLTRHEREAKTLPADPQWRWRYRLPTDAEWSSAAGNSEYPWGDHWPPTGTDGNYCGVESRIGFTDQPGWACLDWFRDPYPRTAPVGSFKPNTFGFHDLAGNVWEWCDTWYTTALNARDVDDPVIVKSFPALRDDGGGMKYRVVRGSSWHGQRQVDFRTRMRGIGNPRGRFDDFGFRCVLERVAIASE